MAASERVTAMDCVLGPSRTARIVLPADFTQRDLTIIEKWLALAALALDVPPLALDATAPGDAAAAGTTAGREE